MCPHTGFNKPTSSGINSTLKKIYYMPGLNRIFLLLIIYLSACEEATIEIHNNNKYPNFLIIITDDQRYDAISTVQQELGQNARFPWLKTPNVDMLASEGARFRNAFVVNSLCSPSRAAILTGKYNHLNGIIDNSTEFRGLPFTQSLKRKGYQTGYFGKWHMGSQTGPIAGFNEFITYLNQGKYYDCAFNIKGELKTFSGWVDDNTTDLAIDFIRENFDVPFCCMIGYKSPHSPWDDPPSSVHGVYDNFKIDEPENSGSLPIYSTSIKFSREEYKSKFNKYDLRYFEIITAMDQNIGKLISELHLLNIDENTMIIFMSDNGLYLGEHGLRDKRSAYEESIRIPLIIRYPPLIPSNTIIDNIVLNIDIAPTILHAAGLEMHQDFQGSSVLPLFTDLKCNWRSAFLYEYFEEPMYGPRISVFAVRNENAKLIKYAGHKDWTELFDLTSDPFETKNLYADPDHEKLLKYMEKELRMITGEVDFEFLYKILENN
jgi:arylsulfatase A-like enzyme